MAAFYIPSCLHKRNMEQKVIEKASVHTLSLFLQVQATHLGYLQSLLEILGDTAYTSSLQSRHIW